MACGRHHSIRPILFKQPLRLKKSAEGKTNDRTGNRDEPVDVGFLVVRGDTNLNNERRTNNYS
ncbi:MAG: hypothetical protein V7K97_04625 [Nostoc sp.]|uniref:hypothetical protein n=1 Tax=Nostoc sp. TaxID=1180 RepID=UPI002FF608F8